VEKGLLHGKHLATGLPVLLRSWSNTLLSVRQATQRNAGRKTAGIDGEVALTPQTRAELAVQVHREASSWRPRPVKRVYIPKAGNRATLRPLGIPTRVAYRALPQAC
jgi:RNA-directed DNA polymerase